MFSRATSSNIRSECMNIGLHNGKCVFRAEKASSTVSMKSENTLLGKQHEVWICPFAHGFGLRIQSFHCNNSFVTKCNLSNWHHKLTISLSYLLEAEQPSQRHWHLVTIKCQRQVAFFFFWKTIKLNLSVYCVNSKVYS